MFHECHYRIIQDAKLLGLSSVASLVARNFLALPLAVVLRLGVAAGAAVPEISVYEDRDVMVGQYEIGLARKPLGLCRMPNSEPSNDGSHTTFGRSSSRRHAAHTL